MSDCPTHEKARCGEVWHPAHLHGPQKAKVAYTPYSEKGNQCSSLLFFFFAHTSPIYIHANIHWITHTAYATRRKKPRATQTDGKQVNVQLYTHTHKHTCIHLHTHTHRHQSKQAEKQSQPYDKRHSNKFTSYIFIDFSWFFLLLNPWLYNRDPANRFLAPPDAASTKDEPPPPIVLPSSA